MIVKKDWCCGNICFMKKQLNALSREEKVQTLDLLYTAVSSVRGRDAMKRLLRDLLTESERIMLGRRIWIARLLLRGETYDAIGKKLRAGPGTIREVHRWLKDQFPGYEEAVSGVDKESDRRALATEAREDPFSLAAIKKKYPLHFLLFPAPKVKEKYRRTLQ